MNSSVRRKARPLPEPKIRVRVVIPSEVRIAYSNYAQASTESTQMSCLGTFEILCRQHGLVFQTTKEKLSSERAFWLKNAELNQRQVNRRNISDAD